MRAWVCLLLVLIVAAGFLGSTSARGAMSVSAKHASSALAITPDGTMLVVANPDSGTVSLIDTASRAVLAELPVGVGPRGVAVAPDGNRAYVACQGADRIALVDLAARTVSGSMAVGNQPAGVAVSPDGRFLAVAELGDDRVRLMERQTLATLTLLPCGDRPHGLAFTPDGQRLLVTHLLSGEVTLLPVQPYQAYLPLVQHALTAASIQTGAVSAAPAVIGTAIATWPNVAPAPAVIVNAAGTRAYLPQTMANGMGYNIAFDATVFPKVSVLNLENGTHQISENISLPETDRPVGLPWDVALARGDTELWVANAASNDISVIDIRTPGRPVRRANIPVGDNPRGIVLSPDGLTAFVNNTLAGTVSVIDTQAYTITATITVTHIPLPPALLEGKRLFNSSARPELSQARWISCNTCHIEGGQDGRTWLVQYTGEVPPGAQAVITRNTTSLLGMVETYPLRWSAEWNESADSEFSIRFEQFGAGLIPGGMNPTLGAPNQGRSYELDCLASFIDSLQVPLRQRSLTAVEQRGQAVFESPRAGCLTCHPPPLFTDLKQHDVGTARSWGEWFGPLIDTPALRLLYDSAPYLHDGRARTLREVLTTTNPDDPHGVAGVLTSQEIDDLVAYLLALPQGSDSPSFTYQASSCLGQPARAPQDIRIWAEDHDIVLSHQQAVYNCCARITVYREQQGSLLRLVEREDYPDSPACRCQCTYTLGARAANLPAGTYQVQVWNGGAGVLLAEETVTIAPGAAEEVRP